MSPENPLSIRDLDQRLRIIEEKLGIYPLPETRSAPKPSTSSLSQAPSSSQTPPPDLSRPFLSSGPSPAPRTSSAFQPSLPTRPSERSNSFSTLPSSGLILGAIAALCLLLAAVFTVKLALDSGWLTPVRQIWMTCLFGSLCVASAFNPFGSRDQRYLSILPGVGIAILNIAVYGAAFLHHLVEPASAFVAINLIAILCVALGQLLKQDLYILYATIGVHLGLVAFSGSLETVTLSCLILITWNVAFAGLAGKIRSRRLLAICAYLGFGTTYFIGTASEAPLALLAGVQAALFFIYLFSTVAFSRSTQTPLTDSETWALFPPLLVFYVTEYAWLSRLMGDLAPYLFLIIAAVVWIAYLSAERVLAKKGAPLASAKLVYLFLATIILHAFFFQIVPDTLKPIAGLLIGGTIFLNRGKFDFEGTHVGLAGLAAIVGIGGFLMAVFGVSDTDGSFGGDRTFAVFNGALYGAALLWFSLSAPRVGEDKQIREAAVLFGHLQWIVALYRARPWLGLEALSLSVTVLWIVYAFVVFSIGWKQRAAWLCRSCMFILTFCVLKLLVYDMWNQAPLVRIASLVGLGLALYAFGYLFRRVSEWESPASRAST